MKRMNKFAMFRFVRNEDQSRVSFPNACIHFSRASFAGDRFFLHGKGVN